MLSKVKKFIESTQNSDESFDSFFLEYVKKIQDKNINQEVRNQIRFGILQLSHLDRQIDFDYRKLVNDRNVKFNGS